MNICIDVDTSTWGEIESLRFVRLLDDEVDALDEMSDSERSQFGFYSGVDILEWMRRNNDAQA